MEKTLADFEVIPVLDLSSVVIAYPVPRDSSLMLWGRCVSANICNNGRPFSSKEVMPMIFRVPKANRRESKNKLTKEKPLTSDP